MLSTIQDNLLLISKEIFSSLFEIAKGYIEGIADRLQYLRAAMRKFGVGGFFEALVPSYMQESIRLLIGYLIELGQAIKMIFAILAPVRTEMLSLAIVIAKLLLPTITGITRGLAILIKIMLQSRVATRALAGALMAVSFAMLFFRKAVIARPLLLAIAAVAGAILAIASASATAARWLSILKATFISLFGIETGGILQPITQEVFDLDLDTKIAAISDEMEELEDTTNGAANALKKFIMPFDEVYRIPEKAGAGGLELPDLEDLSELGDLDWDFVGMDAITDKL